MTTELESISGCPGSGKSFLLKQKPNTLLTSTTGITALNLGDSNRTINSTLGFFNRKELAAKSSLGEVFPRLLKISSLYKYIAIDEISMQSGEVTDLIVKEIANHNKIVSESKKYSKKHNLLGLILAGDAGQLPYVADKDDIRNGISNKPYFKAATYKFFKQTNLTEIKRQNDKQFIEALNYLRYGKAKEVVDWFIDKVEFSNTIDDNWEGSTFFAINKEVDEYNYERLEKLNTPEKTYYAEYSGIPNKDWDRNIPNSITVKPGMKVMILVNNFEEMYANGDLGILIDCFPQGVLVELARDKRQVLVNYRTVYNTSISISKKTGLPYEKRIGSCNYLPIRQGDSSSFHKAQGLTLDKVQLSITGKGGDFLKRLSGGLYTGITRVTDYKGLRIVGTKDDFIRACYINPLYLDYLLKLDSLNQPQLMAA